MKMLARRISALFASIAILTLLTIADTNANAYEVMDFVMDSLVLHVDEVFAVSMYISDENVLIECYFVVEPSTGLSTWIKTPDDTILEGPEATEMISGGYGYEIDGLGRYIVVWENTGASDANLNYAIVMSLLPPETGTANDESLLVAIVALGSGIAVETAILFRMLRRLETDSQPPRATT
ncbi:MAG: hypothetical protein JSV94_02235 [Methanobacteriota archaeon]|nr:MAG: hypothetical protein JSV94_02235 [Euryarchaeota archaeon]